MNQLSAAAMENGFRELKSNDVRNNKSYTFLNIYVDSFLQRLQYSGVGCTIGLCYIGCVMYADDLTLFASGLCELQRMIDICVFFCLQCFDAVGWAAGRASGL